MVEWSGGWRDGTKEAASFAAAAAAAAAAKNGMAGKTGQRGIRGRWQPPLPRLAQVNWRNIQQGWYLPSSPPGRVPPEFLPPIAPLKPLHEPQNSIDVIAGRASQQPRFVLPVLSSAWPRLLAEHLGFEFQIFPTAKTALTPTCLPNLASSH